MTRSDVPNEPSVERQVFPSWSIRVPATFDETFIDAEGYWHGYDAGRSVSLSSVVITERRRPVAAGRILRQVAPSLKGSPVERLPPGLLGRAVTCAATQPAKASRVLSGLLVTDGRVLLVTVTSDDLEWAQRVWLSIRSHPAPLDSVDERSQRQAGRGVH